MHAHAHAACLSCRLPGMCFPQPPAKLQLRSPFASLSIGSCRCVVAIDSSASSWPSSEFWGWGSGQHSTAQHNIALRCCIRTSRCFFPRFEGSRQHTATLEELETQRERPECVQMLLLTTTDCDCTHSVSRSCCGQSTAAAVHSIIFTEQQYNSLNLSNMTPSGPLPTEQHVRVSAGLVNSSVSST